MKNHSKTSYMSLLEEIPCNLCGADNFEVIYPPRYDLVTAGEITSIFRSSGDEVLLDQLVCCKECGLQYLNPRLNEDLIIEAYSSGSDERFISQASARERTFKKYINLIEKFTTQKGRILDIGTAGGSFLGVAQKNGWDVAGCEPNRWLAEWGSRHYRINIHSGTLFDMNLESNSFNVVTLWDVLEHTYDPKAVILECCRVLKPGGLLLVNYPDIESLVARLMGRNWVFLLSVHLYYFTFSTIKKMLSLTGFRVIKYHRHWQTLELGYIFSRMKPYIPGASQIGMKAAKSLRIQHAPVPYWMGQTLVLARTINSQ